MFIHLVPTKQMLLPQYVSGWLVLILRNSGVLASERGLPLFSWWLSEVTTNCCTYNLFSLTVSLLFPWQKWLKQLLVFLHIGGLIKVFDATRHQGLLVFLFTEDIHSNSVSLFLSSSIIVYECQPPWAPCLSQIMEFNHLLHPYFVGSQFFLSPNVQKEGLWITLSNSRIVCLTFICVRQAEFRLISVVF